MIDWIVKNKWKIIILLVVVGLIYWIFIRPNMVRSECNDFALQTSNYQTRPGEVSYDQYNRDYTQCLRGKGL
jgi:hypothetical protein